jgi:hypothetical protein
VMWACWREGTIYDPLTHQGHGKTNTPVRTPLAA